MKHRTGCSMSEQKKRSRLALVLAVILVFLAGGAWLTALWLGRPKPIPPEKIVRAECGNIARAVVAVGRIEPLSKVEVKSKANGIIQSLSVDVGDKVAEGQILAELDKEYLAAQVREARATKDGEEANLQVAIAAEAKARIEAANPELEFARRDHERLKRLFAEKIASQQALDEAEKQYEVSVNRRQLLEAAARSAAALVTQARARVAAAQAAFERAEEDMRNTTIRSPINGMVLTRDREVGDAVSSILNLGSAATLMMTLGDVSSVYVEGQVDEADVGKIRTGLPVRTTVESFPGETFAGTVTRIAPMGRQKENVTTFDVRVSIANPQGKLRVNMSANAEIVLEDRTNALLVPEAALVRDGDGKPFVQRREPSSKAGFRKVPVKTGISNGQRTEVLDGLSDRDELVLP
jgi:HlyD family secretion protein